MRWNCDWLVDKLQSAVKIKGAPLPTSLTGWTQWEALAALCKTTEPDGASRGTNLSSLREASHPPDTHLSVAPVATLPPSGWMQ